MYKSYKVVRIPFNFQFILKLSIQALLVVILVLEIGIDKWIMKSRFKFDGLFILSYTVLCLTMILVMLQTEIRRRAMHPVCPILFIFWFTVSLAYLLRFYSNIIRLVYINPLDMNLLFLCVSGIAFVLILFNVVMDCWPRYSPDQLVIKTDIPCPEEYASILSKITYSWLDKYIYRWFKEDMTDETAFDLRCKDKSTANTNLVETIFLKSIRLDEIVTKKTTTINSESKSNFKKNPGWILFLSLAKIYSPRLFLSWIFKIVNDIALFVMPFLLKIVLHYMEDKDKPLWTGYGLAFCFLLFGLISTVAENVCFFITSCISIRIRAAIMGMIYRKTLKLNNEVRGKFSSGETVNLMSVDAERIMNWVVLSWFMISCPLQITMAIYLLYQELRYAVFAGLAIIFVFFPLNGLMLTLMLKYSESELKWKDQRIKILTEILNGIKVLKMYAWEKSFLEKVTGLRNIEVKFILRISIGWAFICVVWEILPFLIMLVTFLTYVYMDRMNIITAEKAFVSVAVFNLLRFPMFILPWGLTDSIYAFVSMRRVGDYLVGEEMDPNDSCHDDDQSEANIKADVVVEVHDGSFTWQRNGKIILSKIDLDIRKGYLVAIVGKVGAGKSSLISAILGEMYKKCGSIKIKGKLAYVSQEAWIQNRSLKENILFTEKYDDTFYNKIIDACALKSDLEQLADGDATEIGERGINLSGGQKQRVSLARAVYQNRDIYLLDDPLSAVDAHVGQHLFDNVISNNGILQGKTRILVTHGLNWLPKVDEIFILNSDGVISERGSFKELIKNSREFVQLIQDHMSHRKLDTDNSNVNTNENNAKISKMKSLLENISQRDEPTTYFPYFDAHRPSKHQIMNRILVQSKYQYEKKDLFRRKSVDLLSRQFQYIENSNAGDKFDKNLSWKPDKGSNNDINEYQIRLVNPISPLIENEAAMTGKIKFSTYIMYFKARGIYLFGFTLFIYLVFAGLQIYNNVWLKEFTEDALIYNASSSILKNVSFVPEMSNVLRERTEYYMKRYTYIGILMLLAICIHWYGFTIGSVNASKVIHKSLLYSIFRTGVSFFNTTPAGRIINRFSKDMDLVDHIVPMNLGDAINCILMLLSSFVVIIYATPWYTVVIIPLTAIYFVIQYIYMPTSRQSRRLDSIAVSPIFNNFMETLHGVSVIRAFNVEDYFRELNQRLIDISSKFKFIQYSSVRWLSLRIDTLANLMIFVSVLLVIIYRETMTAGLVGLSISYSLQITESLNWLLRQYADLETNFVSLERIREYSKIESEAEWNIDKCIPDTWPSSGDVTFTNFNLRYRKGLPLVLKDINLHLKGGEKVGVVGRTGAGKSSLNLALFRLVEPYSGSITIDGIDISTLGLHDLRKNLTILPQDPVVFSGSLRENMDPFMNHQEVELIRSLETAHLKEWVSTLNEGIDYECGESGINLSAGQKQLLCLARALLRKSKVLILDEATASVDMETDRLVMQTIRDCFPSSTVIIIAHRINTILDADKIVVMDNGRVVEVDSPKNLLATPGSVFKSLAEQI